MKKYLLSFIVLLSFLGLLSSVTYAEDNTGNHVHEMGEWKVTPATCGEEGYKERACMTCAYSEKEIIPATGDHIMKWDIVESTCINGGGYEDGYCINCDYEIFIDLMPTDEHRYGAWKAVSKATAYIGGKDVRSCKLCGHKEYRSTPKLKKKISKDEQNVKKVTDTFFKYLKKYDVGKMKKCFVSPKKVKFFSSKKYLSKYIRKHNKSISYQLRDIKVTGKTAIVTVSCKYYDAYIGIYESLCDMSKYRSKKRRSSTAMDKYQYNRLLYYDRYFDDYTNKVITIKLKKTGKNWKMLNPSYDLYNVMHCNYTKAYNLFK